MRVTLLVEANVDDCENLALLTIEKSDNPRCLKNLKSKPLENTPNKKA